MKNHILTLLIFNFVSVILFVQSSNPLSTYTELPNPKVTNTALWTSQPDVAVAWGNTDTRYTKQNPSGIPLENKTISLTAWKGERVSAQFVVSNKTGTNTLSYSIGDFINLNDENLRITSDNVFSGFVRYVMTDELNKDGGGACGYRNAADFDYSLSADPIDHHAKNLEIKPLTSQGVWVRVAVPEGTTAGNYTSTITVKLNDVTVETLYINLKVQNRTLPAVSDWKFHLDLWQNPYSVARYYGVAPWSEAHMEALKNEHQLYADAGGKVITASIIYDPWNSQTEDVYGTMIEWIKKKDGSWSFDYTNFDKWVELMMSIGVNKQINCYSMIPWKLSFRYFDEAANTYKDAVTKPGDALYEEMWTAMLKSFAAHLKEKGWFNITHISMDERAMDVMLKAIAIIRKADPDFKISLAGSLHNELIADLNDYCVALRYKYTDLQLAQRRAEGKVTTFYTSCEEARPNTFTFSSPAECEWFAWYAAKANLDGYLRWALNCWVKNPLTDSRFRSWGAGDTYLIYPGARTSMRFERMTEGIQQFEKIRILKELFTQAGHPTAILQINDALAAFDESKLTQTPAATVISNARNVINTLSEAEMNEKSMLTSMIEVATGFMNSAPTGENPGEYSAENTTILSNAIANAITVRNTGTTDTEFQTERISLWNALETYKKSKNVPKASNDSQQVWYSFHTPLRENRFIAYQGDNAVLYGNTFSINNDKFLWKLMELNDGTYAIVSKNGNSNISNVAAYDNPLSTSSTFITSKGWKFTPTGEGKYFIISSGNVQINQTNSGLVYKIYNWGGGSELNDTGCKYIIRQEKITTDIPATQTYSQHFKMIDNCLVSADPTMPLKVYNIAGQELMNHQYLPTGIIIVKTPNQAYKLAVR